jgi:hypothetical protein
MEVRVSCLVPARPIGSGQTPDRLAAVANIAIVMNDEFDSHNRPGQIARQAQSPPDLLLNTQLP